MNELIAGFTAETITDAAKLVKDLFNKDLPGVEKKKSVSNFLYSNMERVDNVAAKAVPVIGFILEGIVDSDFVNNLERQICDNAAELIYQVLKPLVG